MTTLENSLYAPPIQIVEYVPPYPTQHIYGEDDIPTESEKLYSARWRNMRKFGGTGDTTGGNTWSRDYAFVSLPIYEDFENRQQVEYKKRVLKHSAIATRQTRQQQYADMARGRSRFSKQYASKSDRGTNYNTHNFIHIDSNGVILNNNNTPILDVGTEVGPFVPIVPSVPLISEDMIDRMPAQETPTQNGVIMPPPMIVTQPDAPVYGSSSTSSILLASRATNPEVIEAISQRYVFQLTGEKSIATTEHDADVNKMIMETSALGKQFDEKTQLFIDENMQYYVLRKDTGQPTWDSPKWIRHYLTTDFANSYFGRGQSGPIIPGIDLTVSKWAESGEGFRLIDIINSRQYIYGNTHGSENFHVTYN